MAKRFACNRVPLTLRMGYNSDELVQMLQMALRRRDKQHVMDSVLVHPHLLHHTTMTHIILHDYALSPISILNSILVEKLPWRRCLEIVYDNLIPDNSHTQLCYYTLEPSVTLLKHVTDTHDDSDRCNLMPDETGDRRLTGVDSVCKRRGKIRLDVAVSMLLSAIKNKNKSLLLTAYRLIDSAIFYERRHLTVLPFTAKKMSKDEEEGEEQEEDDEIQNTRLLGGRQKTVVSHILDTVCHHIHEQEVPSASLVCNELRLFSWLASFEPRVQRACFSAIVTRLWFLHIENVPETVYGSPKLQGGAWVWPLKRAVNNNTLLSMPEWAVNYNTRRGRYGVSTETLYRQRLIEMNVMMSEKDVKEFHGARKTENIQAFIDREFELHVRTLERMPDSVARNMEAIRTAMWRATRERCLAAETCDQQVHVSNFHRSIDWSKHPNLYRGDPPLPPNYGLSRKKTKGSIESRNEEDVHSDCDSLPPKEKKSRPQASVSNWDKSVESSDSESDGDLDWHALPVSSRILSKDRSIRNKQYPGLKLTAQNPLLKKMKESNKKKTVPNWMSYDVDRIVEQLVVPIANHPTQTSPCLGHLPVFPKPNSNECGSFLLRIARGCDGVALINHALCGPYTKFQVKYMCHTATFMTKHVKEHSVENFRLFCSQQTFICGSYYYYIAIPFTALSPALPSEMPMEINPLTKRLVHPILTDRLVRPATCHRQTQHQLAISHSKSLCLQILLHYVIFGQFYSNAIARYYQVCSSDKFHYVSSFPQCPDSLTKLYNKMKYSKISTDKIVNSIALSLRTNATVIVSTLFSFKSYLHQALSNISRNEFITHFGNMGIFMHRRLLDVLTLLHELKTQ